MHSLHCSFCHQLPKDFTILICDHIICGNCVQHESAMSSCIETVQCKCGVKTYFNKSPNPSCLTPTPLRSPLLTPSTLQSPLLSSPPSRSSLAYSKELSNEIEFLTLQFNRSIQETNNAYSLIVKTLTTKFNALMANVRVFYFECASENTPPNTLAKTIKAKYEDSVARHLNKLTDSLLNKVNKIKSQSQVRESVEKVQKRERNSLKCITLQDVVEEYPKKCKYFKERERLLGYIAQLKEETKIKKSRIHRKVL